MIFGILLLVTVAYKPIYDYREGGYEINHPGDETTTRHGTLLLSRDGPNRPRHRPRLSRNARHRRPQRRHLHVPAVHRQLFDQLCNPTVPSATSHHYSFNPKSSLQQLPPVVFFGRLIATVLPVLDHFNIQASVAAGVPVPLTVYALVARLFRPLQHRRHAPRANTVRRPRLSLEPLPYCGITALNRRNPSDSTVRCSPFSLS